MTQVTFNTIQVDGLDIFYREAGKPGAPLLLLLHGFPSSSHMFRDLLADLGGKYHLIAPDYPGAGLSSAPSPADFEYSFDHLADVMEHFIDALGLRQFALYAQDYGGPVGFRIASRRPELIRALLIQNANAYVEGLGAPVQAIGKLQAAGDKAGEAAAVAHMMSDEGIKENYLPGAHDLKKLNPDAWLSDIYFMGLPGRREIQTILFNNYGSNFGHYEGWHAYFRQHQPPTLITWGNGDQIFITPGAKAYLQDLPNAELHILDGGHFLLDEAHTQVATLIDGFLSRLA